MNTQPDFTVLELLRPQLVTLMGNGGFRALLARALALAKAEVPWLRAAHVSVDGNLAALIEPGTQIDPEQLAEGKVVLVAQLLGLLIAFIGPNLTIGLVREVWPEIRPDDSGFGNGGRHEKSK